MVPARAFYCLRNMKSLNRTVAFIITPMGTWICTGNPFCDTTSWREGFSRNSSILFSVSFSEMLRALITSTNYSNSIGNYLLSHKSVDISLSYVVIDWSYF